MAYILPSIIAEIGKVRNMNDKKRQIRIKKILCPTDFSSGWEDVVCFAAKFAVKCGASLFICHQKSSLWWKSEYSDKTNVGKINEEIERVLSDSCRTKELKWESVIIEGGIGTAKCIASFAEEMSCDLILLGAKHNLLTAPFFGSTIEKIIRRAPRPVFILPAGFSEETTEIRLKRILVNYDFSPSGKLLFDYALFLSQVFDSELHLVHIQPKSQNAGIEMSETPEGNKMAQKIILENLRRILPVSEDFQISVSVRNGSIQDQIIKYALDKKIDLIITPAPEEKFYFEYIFPVWLRQTLENSLRPVMVMPSRVKKAEEAFYIKQIDYEFPGYGVFG